MIVLCKCGKRRDVAGEVRGRPLISFLFVLLDCIELTGAGWSYADGRWWCRYCARRRNLLHAVPQPKTSPIREACNVTDPSPPSGEKM